MLYDIGFVVKIKRTVLLIILGNSSLLDNRILWFFEIDSIYQRCITAEKKIQEEYKQKLSIEDVFITKQTKEYLMKVPLLQIVVFRVMYPPYEYMCVPLHI